MTLAGLALNTGWLVICDQRSEHPPIAERAQAETTTSPADSKITRLFGLNSSVSLSECETVADQVPTFHLNKYQQTLTLVLLNRFLGCCLSQSRANCWTRKISQQEYRRPRHLIHKKSDSKNLLFGVIYSLSYLWWLRCSLRFTGTSTMQCLFFVSTTSMPLLMSLRLFNSLWGMFNWQLTSV